MPAGAVTLYSAPMSVHGFVARRPAYPVFLAAGSADVVYPPNEHSKIDVSERLRWTRLPDQRPL